MIVNKIICNNCQKETLNAEKGWIIMEAGNNGRYVLLMISNGKKYISAYSGERIDFCSVDCFHTWVSAFYEAAMVGVK